MSENIALEDNVFQSGLHKILDNSNELTIKSIIETEIKGEMVVLLDYDECFNKIKRMLTSYKELLDKDLANIKIMCSDFHEMESKLIK